MASERHHQMRGCRRSLLASAGRDGPRRSATAVVQRLHDALHCRCMLRVAACDAHSIRRDAPK
eukprot:CAMPEP_0177166232 /NCGR_PEP_ID=MMETSP0367-20130122/7921_1 /TAXON_ID=447022 ORGANISM="Scrippsiella hangoei-like, Strain SHHI-4" /NCGR_SAMPLE_ID=MMETSP0367 /ASSEMBLY_ACC=CAM_ASM_000362 /LENGTH=62 /DNA_ID=CAMNT_0018612281 /DNA_START=27 /DNA_END=212 /DNA_ORIENTATION=-